MGMQIEKSFVVNAPFQAVWEFLTNPEKVAGCLPGAAITGKLDESSWGGTMTVKVGPVTAGYRGKMRFERLDPEAGEAEIVASAQETRGKGGADMKMKSKVVERGPNETEVTVTSDVNVVGVLAQFGRGMIQDVSDQLFQKFSTSMRRELETSAGGTEPAAASPAAEAAPVVPPPDDPGPPAAPATAAAAPSPPAPSAQPAPSPPAPAPKEDVLDVGALGAAAASRAAGRMLQRPGFWIAVVAAVVVLYFLLR